MRDSPYLSGRGRDWVKKTCALRETLTIAGFALDGNDWDGIYVARRKGDDLIYAGKVDHGFEKQSAAELRKRLTPLIRKTLPYTKRIAHKGIWVEPELNAEIEYRAKSAGGRYAIHSSRAFGRIFKWTILRAPKQRDHRLPPKSFHGPPQQTRAYVRTSTGHRFDEIDDTNLPALQNGTVSVREAWHEWIVSQFVQRPHRGR
ncbi:hypothetical protein [Bradyrhizobium sp. 190]|uniref:ATP dependent DNA ligase n=1 Tax=Bradyrhizobium sp. 190 TaxID=2782658 RepID=UPI001FFB5CC6|nr:hypothetical protein [Bradyrhizobium sp. 190]